MDYAKTAKEILEKIGGEKNVQTATHCMTRLRLVLKDESIPKDDEVGNISGVLSVIRQGGQYQIVIGNNVGKVYTELTKLGNFSDSTGGNENAEKKEENIFSRLCGFISGCMTPLLPGMLGCGMIKVVLTLLTTFQLVDTAGSTYTILNAAGDAFFYFLPIMLACTAAKKMGSNPYLAMIMGAIFLHPDITALLTEGPTSYFGLPVTPAVYSSSVLPILLMVPIMAWLEKFADKICPSVVKIFLKPLIVTFISIPVGLVVIGPLGSIAGNVLTAVVSFLYGRAGWLTIMLLSAAMPFIVMTGMHYALLPLATITYATTGVDGILTPTMFCSNLAQGAASLAVAFKTKDKDERATATAAGISAVISGVTEPAMYGVTLKNKTPMIAAVCGAAVSGLYAGITHVVAYTPGSSPSAISLMQMIGGGSLATLYNGIITLVICMVVTFVLTMILYKPETPAAEKRPIHLASPLSGKVIPLSEVEDPVFSQGVLGEGAAIIPKEGKVFAPADGTVSTVMDSRHAVGITTSQGAELLIHVGLDTVKLEGKGFTLHCKEGDQVKKGELLLEFDMALILNEGYQLTTPVVISNMDAFSKCTVEPKTEVKAGEDWMTIS